MDTEPSPAESFERLRTEVALLRRAVEGMAATHVEPIDFTPTLDALTAEVRAAGKVIGTVANSPALSQSMHGLNAQLDEISNVAAARARQEWLAAISELRGQARTLSQIIGSAQTQALQFRWLLGTGVAAFVGGILFCVFWTRVLG